MRKIQFVIAGIVVVILIIFLFLSLPKKEAGGSKEIAISNCQNITSPGNYFISNDIQATSPQCIIINANNVILDGNTHTLSATKNNDLAGIYLSDISNVTIENFTIDNYEVGIFLQSSNDISVINNTLTKDLQGILLYNNVTRSQVKDNLIKNSANIGLTVVRSEGNEIANNNINFNLHPFYFVDSQNNIFESNNYYNNIFSPVELDKSTSEGYINIPINFSVDLSSIWGCSRCNYDIELSPSSDNLSLTNNNGIVFGEFTPTSIGIHSINLEIKDQNNNIQKSKYVFLVNTTNTTNDKFYVRGIDPTHGQAHSLGAFKADSGSLLFEKPESIETRSCTDWFQISPDEEPKYLLGIVKQINFSLTYNETAEKSSVGVQRFITYDDQTDQSVNINQTYGNETKQSFSFDTDWPMDYSWEWYWQALKLSALGGNPNLLVDPQNPDTAQFTYIYSSTPAVLEKTNKNIVILSATMKSKEAKNASIILGGSGITNLTIQMPENNITYNTMYDGKECNSNTCTVLEQKDGILSFSLNVNNKDYLEISK